MVGKSSQLRIGTSGWNYPDWRETFYPSGLSSKKYLEFYAEHFDTTEVNYSFYHLPRPTTYQNWASQTPSGFVFAVKASRYITHIKRLAGVSEEWLTFLSNASALGEKLGPVLLQFPPSFKSDKDSLSGFLAATRERAESRSVKLALEFRHASWFDPDICELLRDFQTALVIAHSERYPQAPYVPSAPFVYLRFHGPGQLFASCYSEEELKQWARKIKRWLSDGRAVYAYFNNDFHGHALANARVLAALVL
jgi:uncharacterized protein YecE (DUF72 family)